MRSRVGAGGYFPPAPAGLSRARGVAGHPIPWPSLATARRSTTPTIDPRPARPAVVRPRPRAIAQLASRAGVSGSWRSGAPRLPSGERENRRAASNAADSSACRRDLLEPTGPPVRVGLDRSSRTVGRHPDRAGAISAVWRARNSCEHPCGDRCRGRRPAPRPARRRARDSGGSRDPGSGRALYRGSRRVARAQRHGDVRHCRSDGDSFALQILHNSRHPWFKSRPSGQKPSASSLPGCST